MEFWNKLRDRLRKSQRTRSILLYLSFVGISAVFWCFLTFNRDVQLDIEVPVEITIPDNVHLLSKVPDTITVTVQNRGYRFLTYLFSQTPTLKLRFSDYNDGNSSFKIEQSQLKKALETVLTKSAIIVNVLPESINIKYTDLPGKKVPVNLDVVASPREDYIQYGPWVTSPDSVLVFSDAKTLSEINEVYTYHVEEKDLSDTLRRKITIAPISGAVTEPRSVSIMVPIEKLKSMKRTIKIEVRNAPPGVKMLLFPSDVEVTYRSPVSLIQEELDIKAVIDYNLVDLASSNNKAMVIIGEAPGAYKDMEMSCDSVEFIIEKH